ncbi:MAG TPA: hypothetical protein VJT72_13270 [Pseudonocardiaceae bacterium]|nr:hypothetical protein [Pseudonocardiaceae bacterium]
MTTPAASLGRIYVFNATPHDITLVLNRKSVPKSKLAGIEQEKGYVPNMVAVDRSEETTTDKPIFATKNSLDVIFEGVPYNFQVSIPPKDYPLAKDIQLYIFYNKVELVDGEGNAEEPPRKTLVEESAEA